MSLICQLISEDTKQHFIKISMPYGKFNSFNEDEGREKSLTRYDMGSEILCEGGGGGGGGGRERERDFDTLIVFYYFVP